jgi:hypothetical protein
MSETQEDTRPEVAAEDDVTYEELRTQGMTLRIQGDTNSFKVGDLACKAVSLAERATQRVAWARRENEPPSPEDEALKEEGKQILKKLAADVGWTTDTLVTGSRICSRFPETHRLRTSTPLSYHHARALVLIKDEAECEAMLDRAVNERLSVARLFEAVGRAKDSSSIQAGMLRCINCNETIRDEAEMVRLQQRNEKAVTCNWSCAAAHALAKSSNEGVSQSDLDDLEGELQMPDTDAEELALAA